MNQVSNRTIDEKTLAKYLRDIPDEDHMLPDSEYRQLFGWVDQIMELYVTYRQKYVVMKPGSRPRIPKYKGKQGEWYFSLDEKAITSHLMHEQAVCIYAGLLSSKFLCFDVDNGSEETVRVVIDECVRLGVPRDMIYVSTSGGKGYHIEIFFYRPVYTDVMRIFYKKVCKDLSLDEKKVEFRPTHGQSIKLPLSVHRKTGNVCWFLDRETLAPIKTNDYLYRIMRMDDQVFQRIVKERCCDEDIMDSLSGKKKKRTVPKSGGCSDNSDNKEPLCAGYDFNEGWPTLKDSGERYKTMTAIAVYERNRGFMTQDELVSRLRAWISCQNPAYITDSAHDVEYDIRKVAAWVFGPTFHCTKRNKSVVFTAEDMSVIMSQSSKSKRKFLFLTMFFEKKFGSLHMAVDTIASYLHCSGDLIKHNVVPDLVASGIIEKTPGKIKTVLDAISRESNSYRIGKTISCYEFGSPCLFDKYEVDERLTSENFDSIFYETLSRMIPKNELKKRLTKTEIKTFMKMKENAK